MILSDAKSSADWKVDPLLASPTRAAPAFLRMPWDDAQATDFGPWRVVPNDAPLVATSVESASDTSIDLLPDANESLEPIEEEIAAIPVTAGPTEEEVEAMRSAAYAQGLADGHAQGKQEAEERLAQERARDHALLIQVVSALQALGQDHERFFEPMYRLSVHLAEQLVRAELSLSGAAIEQLVKHCLAQFDQPTDKAIVFLNPHDLERLKTHTETVRGLRLEADVRLPSGSVRVQVNDTVVEDLIEHRLDALARQLLGDAHTSSDKASLDLVDPDVGEQGGVNP